MFGSVEEAEDKWTCANRSAKWRLVSRRGRSPKGKPKSEPTKPRVEKPTKAREAANGNDKVDLAKAKTKTWADVVVG